jgi:hypothetical protein
MQKLRNETAVKIEKMEHCLQTDIADIRNYFKDEIVSR